MNQRLHFDRTLFRTHWFFLAVVAILAVDVSAVLLDRWQTPRLLEAGLLFDLALLIPLLYFLCYRTNGRRVITRALALACLGIWAVGHIVPEESHQLVEKLRFLRYVGLAVLIIIEVKLVAAIYRATFRSDGSAKEAGQIAAESEMPRWVARLMIWEASMWHKLWRLVKPDRDK